MLRKAVQDHPDRWEQMLPAILLAYRITPSDSTGFTPFRLVFGREMRLGVDYVEPFPDMTINHSDFGCQLALDLENSHRIGLEFSGKRHKQAKEF